jgi:hypothetical protein
MNRRTFATLAGSALPGGALSTRAEQAGKLWHIGYLAKGHPPPGGNVPAPLRNALQALTMIE